MSYLLDTNVISELVRTNPNPEVMNWFKNTPDEMLYLSVLTLGEIRKGIEAITDINRKEKVRVWLEHELPMWFEERILSIDQQVADRWGRLQSEMKGNIPPAVDSLIVATALSYDMRIVTRNKKDFDCYALEVVNPWEQSF